MVGRRALHRRRRGVLLRGHHPEQGSEPGDDQGVGRQSACEGDRRDACRDHASTSRSRGFSPTWRPAGRTSRPFQPKHFFAKIMPKYNPKADEEAKAAGFEDWTKRFTNYYQKWHDDATVSARGAGGADARGLSWSRRSRTPRRGCSGPIPTTSRSTAPGSSCPTSTAVNERFLNADLQTLAVLNGEIDFKAQGPRAVRASRPTRRTRRRAATTCCCRRARSAQPSPSTSPTPIRSCARSTATCASARRCRTRSTATR